MKVHSMKYLKTVMICSVVKFVANNRDDKILHFASAGCHFVSPNESETMASH